MHGQMSGLVTAGSNLTMFTSLSMQKRWLVSTGYYHELFLRGKAFLCHRMERVKIKGSKPGRIKAYADAEPDFYRMRPMPTDAMNHQDDGQGSALAAEGASSTVQRQAQHHQQPQPQSQPVLPRPPSNSNTTVLAERRHREIRPVEGVPSYHDFGSREISFIAGQPMPMPLSRNSMSGNEEYKQQNPLESHHHGNAVRLGTNDASSATNSLSFVSTYKQDEVLMHLSGQRLMSDATGVRSHSTPSSLAHPFDNDDANDGTINYEVGNNVDPGGSSFSTVHPVMQASGRINLESLRDSNSGFFASLGGGQGHLQLFMSLMNPVTPVVLPTTSSHATTGAVTQQAQLQDESAQNRAQVPLDFFDMPDGMLSQYLPTAESLTQSDLFGTNSASPDATGTAMVGASTASLQPQLVSHYLPAHPSSPIQLSLQGGSGNVGHHNRDTMATNVTGDNCHDTMGDVSKSDEGLHHGGQQQRGDEQDTHHCAHQ